MSIVRIAQRFAFLSLPLLAVAFARAESDKPNILLIMADDVGMEALGCYGSASYSTPHLDKLAESGMRFSHCYSQPLCTPSRVQIMTGRYNHRNYTHFGVLPKTEITFGHLLKQAGYATAVAGKWQLYGANTFKARAEGLGFTPEEAGFDKYLLWQLRKGRGSGERYGDPLIESDGKEPESLPGQYGPDVYTDYLLEFMEANADRPFFAYYPMALPHEPFVPTPRSVGWDKNRYQRDKKYFADMIEYMDSLVGRFVSKLEELGLRENTLVIFTGDNGTHGSITSKMVDGRTIKGNKGKPDDGGTHVPLIANWPGTISPGINDNLIDFSDFLPTLVEFAGGTLPGDRILDGQSFAAQLLGRDGPSREWVFVHYDPRWAPVFKPARFARTRRWKLYGDGRFFDVTNDRLEENVINERDLDAAVLDIKSTLQTVLDGFER